MNGGSPIQNALFDPGLLTVEVTFNANAQQVAPPDPSVWHLYFEGLEYVGTAVSDPGGTADLTVDVALLGPTILPNGLDFLGDPTALQYVLDNVPIPLVIDAGVLPKYYATNLVSVAFNQLTLEAVWTFDTGVAFAAAAVLSEWTLRDNNEGFIATSVAAGPMLDQVTTAMADNGPDAGVDLATFTNATDTLLNFTTGRPIVHNQVIAWTAAFATTHLGLVKVTFSPDSSVWTFDADVVLTGFEDPTQFVIAFTGLSYVGLTVAAGPGTNEITVALDAPVGTGDPDGATMTVPPYALQDPLSTYPLSSLTTGNVIDP